VKVLWCVTGGEHLLAESAEALESLKEPPTVLFSGAGEEVAAMYGLKKRFEAAASEVVYERLQGSSTPQVMRLPSYRLVVVAPCTANTAAKVALGIADSAVTNVVSQALKLGVKVILLPTDAYEEMEGATVSGRRLRLRCRDVDIGNVQRLALEMGVVYSADELKRAIE
jgi:dihydromethanopterin reductase (acceptor)